MGDTSYMGEYELVQIEISQILPALAESLI